MDLGQFSTSLAVKDLKASKAFYEALGFSVECGAEEEKWLFMACGDTRIGLFEGMFEDNILTFNPPDARAVETALKEAGIKLDMEAKAGAGPCTVMLCDPDGNRIMLDQI
ncbi:MULTISPECIES: VOC family protein [Kordiimonas]|jgi:catechol 2,3-dioxygenase-like lactoylglutathione lyase family enzyme|uniref:VOC family protein n=1 Tax=Kordiimonas TaxID=288021 RepID=UPI00257C2767|nr:VOC family protein [Kordiimonas sp. UBA4487]